MLEYRVLAPKPACGLHLVLHRAIVIFLALLALVILSAPADAASKRAYAGIVVDAKTGKTLYASAADSPRYPASVTKVMTLYILFQELEAGRVKLNTKFKVSKHAAAAVPTKLGLPAGSTITVEDAIKSLVTLSANDMARAIAENISGSESEFAKRMTRTAKALGMNHTTYKNASGLPDSGQVTTVRDQSRLAIAIYQHFPKYYEYFQTRVFKYKGRSYSNHNNLLGQNGIDGIKTGYINAAGYNLMTAARKDNRHLVVIAFGFNTGASRNAKVASLVATYLKKARKGSYYAQAQIAKPGLNGNIRVAAIPVTPMPRPLWRMPAPEPAPMPAAPIAVAYVEPAASEPAPRPLELVPETALGATQQLAALDDRSAPTPHPKPVDIVGAWIEKTLRLEPEQAEDGTPLPPAAIGASASPANTIDLMTSGAADTQDVTAWVVQIGASNSEDGAKSLIESARGKIGPLTAYRSFIETTSKNGQVFYRARFAGFGDREQANGMCETIKKQNMSCLAMQG